MKASRLLSGVVTALGTALDSEENLLEVGMRTQVAQQLQAEVDGLLVLGSMGAMQLLGDDTCAAAIEVVTDAVGGRVPVIVGCGDAGTERSLRRVKWAEQNGADGIALVSPFFFAFTPAEVCAHFVRIAESTQLPVYLYNLPIRTHHTLTFEMIVQLSRVGNIVGLKESCDLNTLRRCADHFGADGGFSVLSGLSPFPDLALQAGAHGLIDGIYAVAPEYAVELYRCFRNGDAAGVRRARTKIDQLTRVVVSECVFGGFTAAMNLRGVPGNFAPQPFASISAAGKQCLHKALRGLGIELNAEVGA